MHGTNGGRGGKIIIIIIIICKALGIETTDKWYTHTHAQASV
jgi:hypothetical protein